MLDLFICLNTLYIASMILLIDSYFSYLFTSLYNTKLIKLENIFIL